MNATSTSRSRSVVASYAKSISSPLLTIGQRVVAQPHQVRDGLAQALEVRPHGLPGDVAVVDAFQDHRDLEVPEGSVPRQAGQVDAAPPGVPLAQLGAAGEPEFG